MYPEGSQQPRIGPVEGDVEGLPPLNIFRTLAHHPKLLDRFQRFGGFLLYRGLLPDRERELVILRAGFRCCSVYEYGQHAVMGTAAGLTAVEIERLATEATDGWAEADLDLVIFADELCATNTV